MKKRKQHTFLGHNATGVGRSGLRIGRLILGAKSPACQNGMALLLVLVMVVVLGLTVGITGQSWRAIMQRERETELLFRGQQYQKAIEGYYRVKQTYPTALEQLLKDDRFAGTVRHLRRLYRDPVTGTDWELIKDPAQRIVGVRSGSDLQPFRTQGFPEDLKNLAGKTSYQEWEFVYKPPKAQNRPGPAAEKGALEPREPKP